MITKMYSISLLLSVVVAFSPKQFANGSDVSGTNQSMRRFMADTSKHKIENSEQYRKEELNGFLKTGKLPAISEDEPLLPKKESVQKGIAPKRPKVSTEVLMKEYLDGEKHVKNHLNATGRSRGPDTETTEEHANAPLYVKSKGEVPPAPAPKIGTGKTKSPPPSKAPKSVKGKVKKEKVAKKLGKKKKGEKNIPSDFPSTSPTPTMPPAKGDVPLSPTLDSPTLDFGGSSTPNFDTGANGRSFNDTSDGPSEGNIDPSSSSSNSSTVAKVVSPLAAFAGLLIVGGLVLSRRRSSEANLDGNDNLMKHTREGFDVETGTVSGNTYRTGVFTEDDGTLEGSVDASEGHRNSKMSQKYLNGVENVVKDLEEVSLGDDGASTTSFSSDAYASASSCEGRLIDAVRASMTAEAFKPDKSKVYDTSIKPEWASRSKTTVDSETSQSETGQSSRKVGPEIAAAADSSFDDSSMKSSSYKKFILASQPLEKGKNTHEVDMESPAPFETETKDAHVVNDNTSETPSWMKAQLRPVLTTPLMSKSSFTENSASNDETEPEWMKKFRQMGLEKKE